MKYIKISCILIWLFSFYFETYAQSSIIYDEADIFSHYNQEYTRFCSWKDKEKPFEVKIILSKKMTITVSHLGSIYYTSTDIWIERNGEKVIDTRNSYKKDIKKIDMELEAGEYHVFSCGSLNRKDGELLITISSFKPKAYIDGMNNKLELGVLENMTSKILNFNTYDYFDSNNSYNMSLAGDVFIHFFVDRYSKLTFNIKSKILTRVVLLDSSYSNIKKFDSDSFECSLDIGEYFLIIEGQNESDGDICLSLNSSSKEAEVEINTAPPNNIGCLKLPKTNYTVHTVFKNRTENTSSIADNMTSIQYYDGLGRHTQTVQRGITPKRQDLLSFQKYDYMGRISEKWLPLPILCCDTVVQPFIIFFSSMNYYKDKKHYLYTVYENSSLNRILEQFGAGESWQETGHSIKNIFMANSSCEEKLCCSYYIVNSSGQLFKNGNYCDGELFVTKTLDEDNNESYSFKDKWDKVILTRQINKGECHDTYYVYDDFGNLCFVIPPMAADILITDKEYLDTEDALQKYAYIYKYDYRNRCISKKLPGAEPIIMVYDSADHLLFTQDGEQRKKGEWVFTVPDIFNRPTVSGICKDIRPDDYKNIVVNAIAQSGNEGFMGTGYQLNNIQPSSPSLLSVSYYDNYDFLKLSALQTIKDKLDYVNLPDYAQQYLNSTCPEISAKSLLTGTRIFMLDNSQKEIITTNYYDDRGRIAQTRSTNQLGGFDNNTFAYTFTGKPIKHLHEHSANGKPNIKELTSYSYDHAERLIKTTHSLNDASPVVLAENSYDELGRLYKKNIGGVINTNYEYNIRNWLTLIDYRVPINDNFLYYSEKLSYNTTNDNVKPLFNGNISAIEWTSDDEIKKKYTYEYDGLNRMTLANYSQENAEINNQDLTSNPNFTERIDEYDKHGNIKSLSRAGVSKLEKNRFSYNPKYDLIDILNYTYDGNKLINITDAATDPLYKGAFNFVDGNKTNEVEYTYDANGNLTQDKNKGIAKIQYNKLNLPDKLQFAYGHTTEYLYDAAGVKHSVKQTTVKDNLLVPMGSTVAVPADKVAITNQIDYCGNMVYENGRLMKIFTEEGFITMWNEPEYGYFMKDHQGNNQIVACNDDYQSNQYYPFGTTFGKPDDGTYNRYKYNGKELDRMHGLDLYDYGARMYDSAIGRWGTMDPLAEGKPWISPYVYCLNNPIMYIDPDGLWESTVGGYKTNDRKDIEQFFSYYQAERATSKKDPDVNQILSFIGTVKGEGQAKLSDGSHLLSNASMTKLGSNGNWTPDKQSFNNVWNEVANIRSGRSLGCGDFFNGMNTFADLGGLGADILKATGTLGTIGVWRNFSKVCTYSSGWKGNGTVRTFGAASTLGYGMFGLSVIANLGLTYKNQQSITAAGVNIGINTLMLKLPLPVSIGYGVGSTVYQIQQSTFNTLIENGHGDNPGLFNEDFLH